MEYIKLFPGVKITAREKQVEKNPKFPPFSEGFISYPSFAFTTMNNNIPSCPKIRMMTTRKGKKGKQRLDLIDLNLVCIYDDKLRKEQPKYFYDVYNRNVIVTTEVTNISAIALSPLDFLAWSYCYRSYLNKAFSNSGNFTDPLPRSKRHAFNKPIELYNIFRNDPETAIDAVSSLLLRDSIIRAFRTVELTIYKYTLKNRLKIAGGAEYAIKAVLSKYDNYDVPKKYISLGNKAAKAYNKERKKQSPY